MHGQGPLGKRVRWWAPGCRGDDALIAARHGRSGEAQNRSGVRLACSFRQLVYTLSFLALPSTISTYVVLPFAILWHRLPTHSCCVSKVPQRYLSPLLRLGGSIKTRPAIAKAQNLVISNHRLRLVPRCLQVYSGDDVYAGSDKQPNGCVSNRRFIWTQRPSASKLSLS